jgi:hypothetical protein
VATVCEHEVFRTAAVHIQYLHHVLSLPYGVWLVREHEMLQAQWTAAVRIQTLQHEQQKPRVQFKYLKN